MASCATSRIAPDEAWRDIKRLEIPGYPSCAAVGVVFISSGGVERSGTVMLALDGDRYRVEVIDAAGRTALAVAGFPGRMVKVDPATGEREVFTGVRSAVARLNGLAIPAPLLSSIVTGAPPPFTRVISASVDAGMSDALVDGPRMRFVYSGRMEKIVFNPGGESPLEVYFGPMAAGAAAPYVYSARIKAAGGEARVVWKRVRQKVRFPEGFFSFEEPLE